MSKVREKESKEVGLKTRKGKIIQETETTKIYRKRWEIKEKSKYMEEVEVKKQKPRE